MPSPTEKSVDAVEEHRKRSMPKYTDPDKVRELITVKGLSYREAGRVCGISAQAIGKLCKSHGIPSQAQLKWFKAHRGDILTAKQLQLINSVDDDSIKKVNAYQRTIMAKIYQEMERLERDQSTQNVAILEVPNEIREIEAELAELSGEETVVPDTPEQIEAEIESLSGDSVNSES